MTAAAPCARRLPPARWLWPLLLLFGGGPALATPSPRDAGLVSTRDTGFVLPAMPGGGFRVDLDTMLDRRFYTVVRQRFDFSCGSAALATLLRYHYGVPTDEDATFAGMWDEGDRDAIRRQGFSLLDMKRYLATLGLETEGYRVTLDQIAEVRVPGIALTVTRGYRHFVVIKGVSADEVLIGDPSRGLMSMPRAAFEAEWDGLYFVVTSARDTGQASFNRAAQWASVGRAPTRSPLLRPQDQDVLRLASPALIFHEY